MTSSLSLSNKNLFTSHLREWFSKLTPYLFAIGLFLLFGVIGQMDYEDEIRAAAFACEQKYGQEAVFIEKEDGWYCHPLLEKGWQA